MGENITIQNGAETRTSQTPDEIIAAQAAEQAETAIRQAAMERRNILENSFFMVCQKYFGDTTKRGTKELLAKAFEIVNTDMKEGMKAFGVVVGLDKELTRIAGDLWWDNAEWHPEPEAIQGAAEYLGVVP